MSLDAFYLINQCQSISYLEINFKDNIHLSIIQNYNLGQCLKHLQCLNSLNMREAYLNLQNLIDFQIIFQGKNKEFQQIFDQVFDGLRFSKNLQSLLVGFEQRFRVKDSMFFDKLHEEIVYLNQLKNLSISISWGISICQSNMQVLGMLINKLPQLIKFSICTPLSTQTLNTKFIGIENNILQLQKLKELSLKIIDNHKISIYNLLFSITQLKNLENTELDLY
ncbi:hypothetical protein ABPG72_015557, partial [Tetrahymena utriculariae]